VYYTYISTENSLSLSGGYRHSRGSHFVFCVLSTYV